MAEKMDLKVQIKAVELISIELIQPTEVLPHEVVFNFNITVEHKINPQDKLIFVFVGINIFHRNLENILGKVLVNCVYSSEKFDDIVKESEPMKYDIPDEIIDLLNSISISTTRGVMASAFRGTVLHNAILPIVNPKDFQKQKTL